MFLPRHRTAAFPCSGLEQDSEAWACECGGQEQGWGDPGESLPLWGSSRLDSSSSSSCFTERSSSRSKGPSSWSGSACPPTLAPGPSVSGIALLQRKVTQPTSKTVHTQLHSFQLKDILLFMPAFLGLHRHLDTHSSAFRVRPARVT